MTAPNLSRWAPIDVFDPTPARDGTKLVRRALDGEIAGVTLDWISMGPDTEHVELMQHQEAVVWMFLAGSCTLSSPGINIDVRDEAAACARMGTPYSVKVSHNQYLIALRIGRQLSNEDYSKIQEIPNDFAQPWFRRFSDCPIYLESIKTQSTTSRTLLSPAIIPRMAAGIVEAKGPNAVALHRHSMLEQIFVGLVTNKAKVTADGVSAAFPAFSLCHVPLASLHGIDAFAGAHLRYVWIDFFFESEGERWLEGHLPAASHIIATQ